MDPARVEKVSPSGRVAGVMEKEEKPLRVGEM